MQPIDFEASLNDEQRAAAMAPDGPILVLAAAGTGKTRTLVYRVAHLVERGVDPGRILLLTFTNKAAREMLDRAHELVGDTVSGVWGGTFHHLANRILRRYGGRRGYPLNFTILDRDDSKSLVTQCVKALKLDDGEFPKPVLLLSLLSTAANTEAQLSDLVERRFDDGSVDPSDVEKVRDAYTRRKRELGAMDFDDLLVECLALMRSESDIAERYGEQFQHILVDEYQDTNTIQAELVDRLAETHRNLLVVGDDFQSIYSWRGANYRNIMSFPERYADAQMYKLETNYRSVPEILEVANACIARNTEQFQKVLRPVREKLVRPRVARLRDGEEQARFVAEQIRSLRREGYPLSEIAVLYRAHFHALELERLLPHLQVPYVITSGIRFFEQAHIKDVCAVLRLAVTPTDELAFIRLLRLLPGVGEKTADKVWQKLGRRFDAGDPAQRRAVGEALRPASREAWTQVEAVFAGLSDDASATAGGKIVEQFVSAYYESYVKRSFEDNQRRTDDVMAMADDIANFESLESFLSDVALLTNVDADSDDMNAPADGAVRLSTVHQAKGLEWSAVFVIWANEGMFPSSRSLAESDDGDAEERRLFYVAITRAKDELCVCSPEVRRMRDGGIVYYEQSRFLSELPSDCLRRESPMLI